MTNIFSLNEAGARLEVDSSFIAPEADPETGTFPVAAAVRFIKHDGSTREQSVYFGDVAGPTVDRDAAIVRGLTAMEETLRSRIRKAVWGPSPQDLLGVAPRRTAKELLHS